MTRMDRSGSQWIIVIKVKIKVHLSGSEWFSMDWNGSEWILVDTNGFGGAEWILVDLNALKMIVEFVEWIRVG